MQSSADSYHLQLNGVSEGPMSVRDLVWKIGMASSDDLILFRTADSDQWQPLDGQLETLKQLASAESATSAAPASPPKLRLKRRVDSPPQSGTDTPPPFPSEPAWPETPPPFPMPADGTDTPPPIEWTDDNPPPPPGSPGYQAVPPGAYPAPTAVPPFTPNPQPAPPPQNAPTSHPVRITTLLTASVLITALLAGYIFFLMPQGLAASAKVRTKGAYVREVGGLNYAVLTKDQAVTWKAASLEKLNAFSSKAKSEASASSARSLKRIGQTDDIIAKHAAGARALSTAAICAKNLSSSYDPGSHRDVNTLRKLELAIEIADIYLPPECRGDLAGGRYGTVASAVRNLGFAKLKSSFEEEIQAAETQLKSESAQIKPTADEADGFARRMMYQVPAEITPEAKGVTDSLGRFDLKLSPGDYYVIATTGAFGDLQSIEWARAFTVKSLTENTLSLDDANLGDKGADGLWKPGETSAIERDIAAIGQQAGLLKTALDKTQRFRADLEEVKAKTESLLNN
jgi:hypothetical protein